MNRATYVTALKQELSRVPKTDVRRIADIEKELDRFSETPIKRGRPQTAVKA